MAGSLSAHLNSSVLTGLTVDTISVAVNTTSSAVNGLPAGPYLRGELTGATLTVGGQTFPATSASSARPTPPARRS